MHPDETEWKEELLKQRGVTNWPDVLAKVSAAEVEVAAERSAAARRAVVVSKTKEQTSCVWEVDIGAHRAARAGADAGAAV